MSKSTDIEVLGTKENILLSLHSSRFNFNISISIDLITQNKQKERHDMLIYTYKNI